MRMFAPSVVLSWTRVKQRYWWLLFSVHLFAYLQSGLLQVCAKIVEDWWRCPSRFYLETVTPQLVQLCVFCSYVVAWYVCKIDFCIYFVFVLRSLSVYVRVEHQELLLVFFCGAVLFLSCFFHFLSYGFLGTLYYEILHVFFVGLIHSPCS